MAAELQPKKPILEKPPGYKDPNTKLPVQSTSKPRKRGTKKRRSFCRICCCTFCILTFILILLILIFTAAFYIWFEPKLPDFHLQSFSFTRFNVTVNPDGTYLNVKTAVRIEVRNPNDKLTYHYSDSVVEVSCSGDGDVDLGSADVGGFTQAEMNVTRLKMETKSNQLVEAGVGPRLMSRYKNKNLVVKVKVRTGVGLSAGRWKIRPIGVNVICGDLTLNQLHRLMPKCTIFLSTWMD